MLILSFGHTWLLYSCREVVVLLPLCWLIEYKYTVMRTLHTTYNWLKKKPLACKYFRQYLIIPLTIGNRILVLMWNTHKLLFVLRCRTICSNLGTTQRCSGSMFHPETLQSHDYNKESEFPLRLIGNAVNLIITQSRYKWRKYYSRTPSDSFWS